MNKTPVTKGEGWQTARLRKSLSAPMRAIQEYVNDLGLRSYVTLDYGCGRGSDADLLNMDKFDPNWFGPNIITRENRDASKGYDIITNIYVLNVIKDPESRLEVLKNIQNLLSSDGIAFIAVRDDIPVNTDTQFIVEPDLDLMVKVSRRYRIYRLDKTCEL